MSQHTSPFNSTDFRHNAQPPQLKCALITITCDEPTTKLHDTTQHIHTCNFTETKAHRVHNHANLTTTNMMSSQHAHCYHTHTHTRYYNSSSNSPSFMFTKICATQQHGTQACHYLFIPATLPPHTHMLQHQSLSLAKPLALC